MDGGAGLLSYAYDRPSAGVHAGGLEVRRIVHEQNGRRGRRAADEDAVGSVADAHTDPHRQTAAQAYSGPGHDISSADYAAQGAAPSDLNSHAGPWPAVSSYPDLSSYQQQPYFYDQPASTSYQSTWDSSSNAPGYGVANDAGAYPAAEHSSATTMPYFPASTSTTQANGGAVDATASAYAYAEPSTAVSFPYPQTNAATQEQQREAVLRLSASYVAGDDAGMNMKIQSLPILDNLATQLIHTISKASYPQIKELMSGGDAEETQAYTTLKSLFDQTRKVYSRETPFIDAIAIQMFQPTQQEIIRKANIATFISSILGAFDVTFYHLNEFFMETFVPLGHRLLKWQGAIYLEMKTQTYISSLLNSQGSPEALLDELFPPDLDAQILTRHPDAPSLSPSEQDFIDRSRARKSYLLAEPVSAEAARELQKKYQWLDFEREFASCINKNVDSIMNVPARTHQTGSNKASAQELALGRPSSLAKMGSSSNGSASASGKTSGRDADKKNGASASTMRQSWSKGEEEALLAGLERVGGPHWSQILALYGRGGSVSEVLKDRNQVQLKDKARNLKLQHLKMGKEVPVSLQGVTGELKKRAGARVKAALGVVDDGEPGEGDDTEDQVDLGLDRDGKPAAKRKKTKK